MNRAQRRAQAKQTPSWRRGKSREDIVRGLVKNGITPEDLETEYKKGFDAGFKAAIPATYETIYAATLVALHRLYGFGRVRGVRALREIDDTVVNYMTTQEAIDAALAEVGVELDFQSGVDRIQEVSE